MKMFEDLLLIRKGTAALTMGGDATRLVPAADRQEWESKAVALRELFRRTLGTPPAGDCPLNLHIESERAAEGYRRREVSYNLKHGERITGTLLIPDNLTTPRPGILAIHQTTPFGREQVLGSDPSAIGQNQQAYARDLVRLGLVVFAYDIVSANSRCGQNLKAFDTAEFYRRHPDWSARGCDLADAARAIDVMEHFPDLIDRERIGAIGHSQGGGITIQAMMMDPRIKVGVSNCGVWPEQWNKNPYNVCRTGWWIGRPLLREYCLTGKDFPTRLHEELAASAPRPILMINAVNDMQYGEDEAEMRMLERAFAALGREVRKVYALYSKPENFVVITHREGHSFTPERHRQAYDFLIRHLGRP